MKVFVKLGITIAVLFSGLQLMSSAPEDRTDRRVDAMAMPAPAGFDNEPNGFVSQQMFESDRELFEERETIADGLAAGKISMRASSRLRLTRT
jgi:hypothetical protein